MFVDIRFKRQGRAAGFVADRFANALGGGESRYLHMVSLGNANIGTGRKFKISKPQAVNDLSSHNLMPLASQRTSRLFTLRLDWVFLSKGLKAALPSHGHPTLWLSLFR